MTSDAISVEAIAAGRYDGAIEHPPVGGVGRSCVGTWCTSSPTR